MYRYNYYYYIIYSSNLLKLQITLLERRCGASAHTQRLMLYTQYTAAGWYGYTIVACTQYRAT